MSKIIVEVVENSSGKYSLPVRFQQAIAVNRINIRQESRAEILSVNFC